MAVVFIVFIAIAFAIAHYLGSKRQIGFGWSLFFCFFLSPIGGFITTMLSPKYYDQNPAPSQTKKVIGWILIVLFSLSAVGSFIRLSKLGNDGGILNALFMAIGFIGLGVYLIELSKGRNFNIEALTKVN